MVRTSRTAGRKAEFKYTMNGDKLVQIHGYKNEGEYTAKGRFAPDPREVYREFLGTWLDWLEKGSRRDKKGKPKLPRKKGAAA